MDKLSEKPYPKITQAIRDGDVARIQMLFSQYPEMINQDVIAFGTWLHYAAAHGTLEIAKYLVSIGFDINSTIKNVGRTPLKNASYEDNYEVAEYLVSEGATLDVSEPERNPLFGAVIGKSPHIVKLLLANGIDAKAKYTNESMENMDAMAFAMERGEIELARMIADHISSGNEVETERLIAEANRIAKDNDRWSPNNRFNPS